jgi:hypothetical protein
MVFLRALGYVGFSALAAFVAGWWTTEDCVRDYTASGGDSSLCGLGWLAAVPVFIGVLVVTAVVGEILVRRPRADR